MVTLEHLLLKVKYVTLKYFLHVHTKVFHSTGMSIEQNRLRCMLRF